MSQTEQLGDDKSPADNAMRDRIREQFTDRYNEHAAITAELDALTASIPAVNDPALLDELPYAPGLLADAPDTIREALYAAFDVQCLYRHEACEVTIWATITDTTPGIIAALLADPRTDSDTAASTPSPALFADLQAAAITPETADKSARRSGGPEQGRPATGSRDELLRRMCAACGPGGEGGEDVRRGGLDGAPHGRGAGAGQPAAGRAQIQSSVPASNTPAPLAAT